MWHRLSLTQKMVALIIPIFLVVFVGFGSVSVWAMDRTTQRTLDERLLLAKTAAGSIDHYNRETLQQLQALAATIDPRATDFSTTQQLFQDARSRLLAKEFFVLDKDGRIVASEPPRAGLIGINLSNSDYVGQLFKSGQPYISGMISSIVDQSWVVSYATPIMGTDDAVIGAVVAGMDLSKPTISGYVEAIKLGKTGYAQVVDGKGNLLASTQPSEVFGESDHGARFIALIQAQQDVVRTCHNCHEPAGSTGTPLQRRRDILAFAPLTTVSWGVAVRQAEEEALAPTRALQMGILAIGAASLLLALSAAVIFVRTLLKPIQALTVGAQQIADGDLSSEVEARGKDEIAVLARAFETMRLRLHASRQEIDKRTGDVERRNMELAGLNAIATTVSQSLDLGQSLEATLDRVLEMVRASAGGVFLVEKEGQPMALKASRGLDETLINLSARWPAGIGLTGEASTQQDSTMVSGKPVSFVIAPLLSKGQLRGVLTVAAEGEHKFDLQQVELLTAVGHQIGVAADNAGLFQQARKREQEAQALYDIGVEISALLDVDKTLKSVVQKAKDLLGADVSMLTSLEDDGRLHIKVTAGALTDAFTNLQFRPGQGLAGSVVSRSKPLTTSDYLSDLTIQHDTEVDAIVRGEGLKAHLGVPLRVGNKVVGALIVAHRHIYAFQTSEINLLTRLANHAALAIENARLYEELQRKEELRGQLLEKVISAQEEERKRISRELHDDSAQTLTALAMQLEAIEGDLPPELHSIRERVAKQKISAYQTLEEIKKLMADLRPAALDDLGLVPAIRWYAENRLARQGVNVIYDLAGLRPRLPIQLETTLFRVFQEAVNNIAKHAEAHTVWISLSRRDSAVRGVVKDDGKGFDSGRVLSPSTKRAGLGLLGMQERVSLFEGTLTIQSQPGAGTSVIIEVPVSEGD